jgi:hypothetical protein
VIATFIYTECQSPGPFKSEPGFKVKDVKIWKTRDGKVFHGTISDANKSQIENLVMEAVGTLPNFDPPNMSPFITMTDFLALEKQWIYHQLPSGNVAFTRMSTSGLTHGRRGNPFHMGIVIDRADFSSIFKFWRLRASADQILSPADLYSWTGWQDPRTAEDVEAAILSEDNFPFPTLLPKPRAIDDTEYISNNRAEIRTGLLAVERSYSERSQAVFGSSNSWEFLKHAAIVSSFLPTSLSWSIAISTTDAIDQYSTKPGWSRALVHGQAQLVGPLSNKTWSGLALEILEKKQFQELESMLYKLARGAKWRSTTGSSGLWSMPFAVLMQASMRPDLFTPEQVSAAALIALTHFPTDEVVFISQKFKDSGLALLENLSTLDAGHKKDLLARTKSLAVQ